MHVLQRRPVHPRLGHGQFGKRGDGRGLHVRGERRVADNVADVLQPTVVVFVPVVAVAVVRVFVRRCDWVQAVSGRRQDGVVGGVGVAVAVVVVEHACVVIRRVVAVSVRMPVRMPVPVRVAVAVAIVMQRHRTGGGGGLVVVDRRNMDVFSADPALTPHH